MQVKAGTKLASTVCDTQVVVVRAPAGDVELGCGGAPLVSADQAGATGEPDPALADGSLIGKRYADEEIGVELLCTKAGAGSLTCNGEVLAIKGAKPLPASD
jgi:hypothetical protein